MTDERVTLDFGKTLQQARTAKGWTQKELSTVSQIGQWESARLYPGCVLYRE